MIIDRFRIDDGVNEYAVVIDITEEDRNQLIAEGYQPWSRYISINPEHYGREEQLWVK